MKHGIVLCCLLLCLFSLSAQTMSFPELQKLKLLDKKKQEAYLLSKKYEKGKTQSDGDNEAVVYKNLFEQDGRLVIRNITLITSKQLKMTMLEYTTYDASESAAIIAWLMAHGYRKSTDTVDGHAMTFFKSAKSGARYYEDKGKLPDGSDFNSGTFVLEY